MAKRKFLFIAAAPLMLLLGMMLSFRLLSQLPASDADPIEIRREISQPAPKMEPADPATQKALQSAVQGQLSAIRKGDYDDALTFSAPSFRESWNAKRFQEMIENQYKEMAESTAEEYEPGRVAENAANIRVVVTTADNTRVSFIYNLTREAERWYVQACSRGFQIGPQTESVGMEGSPGRKMSPGRPMMPNL